MNSQLLAHVDTFNDDNNSKNVDEDTDADGDDRSENGINEDDSSGAEVDHDDDENENDEDRHRLAQPRLEKRQDNVESMKNDTAKTIILVATSSLVSFIAGNVVSSCSIVEASFLIQYKTAAVPIVIFVTVTIAVVSVAAVLVSQSSKQQLPSSVTNDSMMESTSESSKSEFETDKDNKESQLDECRIDVSRILGLIGAPPLQWRTEAAIGTTNTTTKSDESRERQQCRRRPRFHNNQTHRHQQLHDDYYSIICEYFQVHAQLLLAVDECYYWIKVTSGLHLGLGPRSQATERAELASISRSQRRTRQQPKGQERQQEQEQQRENDDASSSVSETNKADAETTTPKEQSTLLLSPQHRIDTGTILSLSSTRRSVAKILSQQSTSILALYRSIKEDDHDKDDDEDLLLVIPDVVDLAWIKAARKHLGRLLSDCANAFLVIGFFDDTSRYGLHSAHFLQQLENSIKNAEQAREYIKSNILSSTRIERTDRNDSLSSAIPFRGPSTQRTQKLLPYLIHHQEKMEGLHAAMKIIYEYYFQDHRGNDQDGNDPIIVRWWNEVKHWSASVVAIEREIEGRFFVQHQCSKDSETVDDDKNQNSDTGNYKGKGEATRNYEFNHDGGNGTTPTGPGPSSTMKSKTLVFKGKGAVEPRPKRRTDARSQNNNGTRGSGENLSRDVVDWSRDVMTEHMFVQELQKRVLSLLPAEEDVEEHETEEVDESHRSEDSNDDYNNGDMTIEEDVSVQSLREKDTTKITRSSSTPVAFRPTGLDGISFLAELQQVSFLDQEEDHNTNDSQQHIFE